MASSSARSAAGFSVAATANAGENASEQRPPAEQT